MSLDSIEETAAGIYARYGYGYGDDKEGATLTLLLEPTEDGAYAMPEGGWCVYANLSEARGSSQALTEAVRDAVEPYMAARAWNGQDMAVSAAALAKAVDAMTDAVADYLLETPRRITTPKWARRRRRPWNRAAPQWSMYLTSAICSLTKHGRRWSPAPKPSPSATTAQSISPWWTTTPNTATRTSI